MSCLAETNCLVWKERIVLLGKNDFFLGKHELSYLERMKCFVWKEQIVFWEMSNCLYGNNEVSPLVEIRSVCGLRSERSPEHTVVEKCDKVLVASKPRKLESFWCFFSYLPFCVKQQEILW